MRVALIVGTRPEAIKLAPVARAMRRLPGTFDPVLVLSGQHAAARQTLAEFDLEPDADLGLGRGEASLAGLGAELLAGLDAGLAAARPDWVLVQGDTTTALAGALAAFYRRIPVGHVEAGLRTGDPHAPYPEEIHRRLLASLADLHFAPTDRARDNLLREGVRPGAIRLAGNTGVDALLWARDRNRREPPPWPPGLGDRIAGRRLVVVTAHRRESFGAGLERICRAVRELAERCPEVAVVFPAHLNPAVHAQVAPRLRGHERVHVLEPVGYRAFVALLERAELLLTDSGGLQEEAPSLGLPVLVLRDLTERVEGEALGHARCVGTDPERIVAAALEALHHPARLRAGAGPRNPYGDGRAALRILSALGDPPPERAEPRAR